MVRILYRVALERAQSVIFQNEDDVDDFVEAGCLRDRRSARLIAGSGVDLDVFQRKPLPDRPVFLLVARLLVTKGVREFVAAASMARQSLPHARFIIVGPADTGPDGIPLSEIKGWPKEDVEYKGELADVRPLISQASVFVLPSYREGTPRAVLEAMAMGRPIITTNVPGCRQVVVDKVSGLIVPSQNAEQLCEAMLRLARDEALMQAMGEAAYQRAKSIYDVHMVTNELLGHLRVGQPS